MPDRQLPDHEPLGSESVITYLLAATPAQIEALVDRNDDLLRGGNVAEIAVVCVTRHGRGDLARKLEATYGADLGRCLAAYARIDDAPGVGLLLAAGADPRRRDYDGTSPLHGARSTAVLSALLDAGADVDLRDAGGRTPLVTALVDARYAIARRLIERGADPEQAIERVGAVWRYPAWSGGEVLAEFLGDGGPANRSYEDWCLAFVTAFPQAPFALPLLAALGAEA